MIVMIIYDVNLDITNGESAPRELELGKYDVKATIGKYNYVHSYIYLFRPIVTRRNAPTCLPSEGTEPFAAFLNFIAHELDKPLPCIELGRLAE